ncbi:LLM class flavin-dependent oxidoreductase [Streptomyces sp. NPDC015232]|uniref:LLM class flavin-dependent oxidoreductase n=1 Tax=unclassified Streptomyces TaxID=2593676 RepID=UPI0036FBD09D
MAPPVPLSVLDLATVGVGETSVQALRTTVELAQFAEKRGFRRFWVGEHHSLPAVSSSSPAVLLAHLAAHTDTIRLGSGGVMLANHAPLVIAEQFGTLQALAPGRIDLGIGRAAGAMPAVARALRASAAEEGAVDFAARLSSLVDFLDGTIPAGHPHAGVHAVPGPVQGETQGGGVTPGRPELWMLGMSMAGARCAGERGMPFAVAHHFSGTETLPALDEYRRSFRPSAWLSRPYVLVCASAVVAASEEEAYGQALTHAVATIRMGVMPPGLIPSPEEAAAHSFSADEQEYKERWLSRVAYGTPDRVRAELDILVASTGADELMITSNTHGCSARLRSFELLAGAYEMPDRYTKFR